MVFIKYFLAACTRSFCPTQIMIFDRVHAMNFMEQKHVVHENGLVLIVKSLIVLRGSMKQSFTPGFKSFLPNLDHFETFSVKKFKKIQMFPFLCYFLIILFTSAFTIRNLQNPKPTQNLSLKKPTNGRV